MSVTLTAEQKTEIANYINAYRAIHQSPPLVHDDTLAEYSQAWSKYLSDNNVFFTSGSKVYGESIAYLKGTEVMAVLKKGVDSWYNEIGSYDFNRGEFSPDTSKLTCLLWKGSTQFGLGISVSGDSVLVVFNTAPLGNYTNQMKQNVLAPILNLRIQPQSQVPQPSIVATPKGREQPIPLREREQAQAQAQVQPPPVPQAQVQSQAQPQAQPQAKGPSKKDIVDGLYQVGNSLYSNKDKVNVALVMNKIINALSLGMPESNTKSALLKDLYALNYAISTSKDMGSCFGTLSTIINQLKAAPAF